MQLSFSSYVIGILLVISVLSFAYGRHEHTKYLEFKAEVENAVKAQEAHVESIKKQQELVNKGIENEYNAKLALLRQYYANGVRQSNTSKLPTISNASTSLDDFTPNGLLVKCAETTQQLVSLQAWLNEQIGIK